MSTTLKNYATIPLRLMLGFGFIYHGWPKLSGGHEGFAAMLGGMGVPAANLMAYVVGLVELLGGLALIAGSFVAIACIPLIINMLVAMFMVHLPSGFNFMNMLPEGGFGLPGYEVNLLYIAGLATLALSGGGALSIDEMRKNPDVMADKGGGSGGPG